MKIKKTEIFEEPEWEKIETPLGDVVTAASDGEDSVDTGDGDGLGRVPVK